MIMNISIITVTLKADIFFDALLDAVVVLEVDVDGFTVGSAVDDE
jgi:hypothetical protein